METKYIYSPPPLAILKSNEVIGMGIMSCNHGMLDTLELVGVFKRTQRVVWRCPVCGSEVERGYKLRDLKGVEHRGGFYVIPQDIKDYRTKIVLRSLRGLGDQIYARPFLREWAKKYDEVWIDSSFPEVFHDIENVRVYRLGNNKAISTLFLRYHHESESLHRFYDEPSDACERHFLTYNMNDLRGGKTILESFNKFIEPKDFDFNLNVKSEWTETARKTLTESGISDKFLILKAPTIRKEWKCTSRSPKMEYYWPLIEKARKEGYKIVSMAYLKDGEEWFDGELRDDLIDLKLHGFLPIATIIGLFALSSGVISFPSFALPLSMAIQKKLFLIYGGYVPHKHLIDKRIDTKNIYSVAPKPFCFCMSEIHDCNKEINIGELERKFDKFLVG